MRKIISLVLFVCVASVGIVHSRSAQAQTSGQVWGAGLGAVGGALIGKALGLHRDGQIVTGAIGAGVGVALGSPSATQVVYVQAPAPVYGGGQVAMTTTCTHREVDANGNVLRYLPAGCTPPGQTAIAAAPAVQQQVFAAPMIAGDGCARFNGTAAEFSCREAARAAYDIEMGRIAQQAAAVGRAAAMRGY